jgi:hypothetical protein
MDTDRLLFGGALCLINGRLSGRRSGRFLACGHIGSQSDSEAERSPLEDARWRSKVGLGDFWDGRLRTYVERHPTLKREAARLLEEALVRGAFERGDIERISGLPERTARRVLGELIDLGLLASDTPKGRVSLRFPAHALEELFPKLFPQA